MNKRIRNIREYRRGKKRGNMVAVIIAVAIMMTGMVIVQLKVIIGLPVECSMCKETFRGNGYPMAGKYICQECYDTYFREFVED